MTAHASAAGTRRLGELTVNRLGYGAMRLTGNGMHGNSDGPPVDRAAAVRLLHTAFEHGVDHVDTASFYFSPLRSANELIGRALAGWPGADRITVATKVGPGRTPDGEWYTMARPDQLRAQVEENLRQLGTDRLDLVNLRRNGPGLESVAEHFGVLAELRRAGLIRELGLSNARPEHVRQAREIAPVVCVQNSYGLDRRLADENGLLELCRELDIAFVPFFAISGLARESAPTAERDARVRAVAAAHGATPAQVRLAWTLHRGPHVLAIPGTRDPAHLAENLDAGALRLTDAQLALLDAPVA
ncbi:MULTISPECIES: aldo/keto reductase [Kitasatospora]|uniref:Putative aldo/keto reductase n=1 Tax=Kitasatospora setae (strain ATCC 33774 / DSM 43861 / JCM 3304 / KCC A-0304 / NBRC 14216 / KM-6054) TaxID=452652 RepID=E4N6W5_KITSK|nr:MULTISPECIES: aldo/keto reductase [Kitasatospora]BAJ26946.1 putative aldo/keto reductase [Kitasatospora setae KM-6054]